MANTQNVPMIRRRQQNGELGPLEPIVTPQYAVLSDTEMMMLEALAGMQEQLATQQYEIEQLKGGAE